MLGSTTNQDQNIRKIIYEATIAIIAVVVILFPPLLVYTSMHRIRVDEEESFAQEKSRLENMMSNLETELEKVLSNYRENEAHFSETKQSLESRLEDTQNDNNEMKNKVQNLQIQIQEYQEEEKKISLEKERMNMKINQLEQSLKLAREKGNNPYSAIYSQNRIQEEQANSEYRNYFLALQQSLLDLSDTGAYFKSFSNPSFSLVLDAESFSWINSDDFMLFEKNLKDIFLQNQENNEQDECPCCKEVVVDIGSNFAYTSILSTSFRCQTFSIVPDDPFFKASIALNGENSKRIERFEYSNTYDLEYDNNDETQPEKESKYINYRLDDLLYERLSDTKSTILLLNIEVEGEDIFSVLGGAKQLFESRKVRNVYMTIDRTLKEHCMSLISEVSDRILAFGYRGTFNNEEITANELHKLVDPLCDPNEPGILAFSLTEDGPDE
eukprot:gb/GECH01000431.1/.p1 GENE.gb/GECH01000431.1/~~gb/GECH01000431.1/.p1  ORF type:complete len:441 (+),score=132.81 gb/GECH01000431.1/:1-1323(+)